MSKYLLIALAEESWNLTQCFPHAEDEKNLEIMKNLIISASPDARNVIEILENFEHKNQEDIVKAYEFIFVQLPQIAEKIKNLFSANDNITYTSAFQRFGDNIRSSGRAISDEVVPSELLKLPETINKIVKLYRKKLKIDGKNQVYVVIDALRHPFEVRYLRERIAQFYLVAITTGEEDRKLRLSAVNYRDTDIQKLNEKEYPSEAKEKKPTGYAAFVSQDIQACLALADVYVNNQGKPTRKDLRIAAQQICRYVALMQHPGLVTPTSVERCMQAAFSAKVNSGCISRQVGAVVTDEFYSIKAVGWNDVPKGQVPCLLRNMRDLERRHDEKAYSAYELEDTEFREEIVKQLGKTCDDGNESRNRAYCFKDTYNSLNNSRNQVHTRSLHAEENAFLQIAKYGGQGIEGGSLFSTASPCELCAKKAYQLGIKNVYYIDPYPGISIRHVFAAGDAPPKVTLFSGAIGRAYHDLYEPIMPYKDELEKLT